MAARNSENSPVNPGSPADVTRTVNVVRQGTISLPRWIPATAGQYGYAGVLAVAFVALAVRLIQIDHAPYSDEMYHMLAARSVLEDGSFHINGPVEYTRAWLFTALVAGLTAAFGDNLVVGRLPAALAGAALVAGTFLWLRRISGPTAAWIGALLLCFAPISIYLSQQVRFYTLHALLFWGAALATYHAVAAERLWRRSALAVMAAVCAVLALHLQVSTLVGLAALALWLVLDRAPAVRAWTRRDAPRRALVVTGAAAVAATILTLVVIRVAPMAVRLFSKVDTWAEANRDYARFYHDLLLSQYPTLWTLFPIAVLIAATRRLRATFFLATLFVVVLIFHSAAAWKHERYIFYALPAFFAIWGIAASVTLPWVWQRLTAVAHERRPFAGALPMVLLAGALLFAAAANRATMLSYRMLTVPDDEWTLSVAYRGEADWQRALPALKAAAERAEVVAASSMVKSLYYLDRVDLGISLNEVLRMGPEREFGVAALEGVPVVSTPESMSLVVACRSSGLVIVDARSWRTPWGVTVETADFIQTHLDPVEVPPGSDIYAFQWDRPATVTGAACDLISTGAPASDGANAESVN
jgi:hypothetical protein